MVKEKNKEVVLEKDDLLNGLEVFIIIEALKVFNEKHKEDVKALEDKGKIPFMGANYFETIINHGLLWKLRKFADKKVVSESETLSKGKLL
tara:strand:- start:306 stop:578 length:273 start_codon:yes stop_codon:yes gene_type:complete